ncbi:MAG: polysaccharide ABC transporter ATP-binding protein [Ruminococcus sp.]|nr:polysaccharide ABC transporter ATP-binding protein [Ruminococcus sp.]
MEQNENRPVAIKVSGVKKMYKLGQIGGGSLQADIQSWWARVRGKEDPNTKIGEGERSYGKTFMALNGIDLTIYQGEAVGIIGSNGAGKSTFLKLLSRVTAPTEGFIDIYGRIASMLEVGTGFNPEMTGRENVYLNGAILGMTKAEIDAKMEQIIEFSEVREFIDTPVKRYSSGMFVKLAFSVAAHLDSEIMIMDEVLAVGDISFQKKCLTKMREAAKQEGRTVLYVSHNMDTIRRLCDKCIVLDNGKVFFEGDVEKAIAIYLKSNELGFRNVYKLDDLQRHGNPTKKIKIEEVDIFNTIPLTQGDKLNICVKWKSTYSLLNGVYFRFLVGINSRLIGIASTQEISVNGLNENVNEFEFDVSVLAPGQYFVNIEIYDLDDGKQTMHESVKAFQFEIIENLAKNNNFHWYKPWGHILFPGVISIDD